VFFHECSSQRTAPARATRSSGRRLDVPWGRLGPLLGQPIHSGHALRETGADSACGAVGQECPTMARRVDENGLAFKRSQLQIQIAVNRHRDELEAQTLKALPSLAETEPELDWRSPLEADRFREYYDGRMLDRIERSDLREALRDYWPQRGPRWDALAVVRSSRGEWLGPLLVEAKSYPAEMLSSCKAEGDRRARIEEQLRATREYFGVAEEFASAWTDGLYQLANRLAFLRFFEKEVGAAWLLIVCVVSDPTAPGGGTGEREWEPEIASKEKLLGLTDGSVQGMGHVFIEGRCRDELVGA
jgi:hypothetical protein